MYYISVGCPMEEYDADGSIDKMYHVKFNDKITNLPPIFFAFWDAFLEGGTYEEAKESFIENKLDTDIIDAFLPVFVEKGVIVEIDGKFSNMLNLIPMKNKSSKQGMCEIELELIEKVDGKKSISMIINNQRKNDCLNAILNLVKKRQIYFIASK